jgi:tripartite-type tricarboxylate transporter receptor subunit TctC
VRHMSWAVSAAAIVSLLSGAAAAADPVDDFYRGKTITMLIGTGEGGGAVEQYPQALAQAMRKYIPGNPTFVVSHMPGAGGIKAANYIYSVAPQDGTYWGFITRGFITAPLLKIPQANFDPTRFNWIGSPARSVSVGVIWTAASPVRSIADAMNQQVVVGATSVGQDTGIFPPMLNEFVGTKFKVVSGYPSVGDIDLAMERSEVQGKIGFTWASLNSGRTVDWVKDKKVAVIVQLGVAKAADIPSDVPLALDLAKTEADREAMEVLCAPSATGYPSFMGPGVPPERIAAIRTAYEKTLKDPDFLAIMRQESLAIDPISGAEITKIVKDIYALPQSAVKQASALLPPP